MAGRNPHPPPEPLIQDRLHELLLPETFIWAAGIEDTFITAPWPATGRTLDEYELTDHYNRAESDIDLLSSLGIRYARYGLPWHKINPQRGVWNWDFPDKTLPLLLEKGVNPIVDLVHYGTPPWIEGAFVNPDYPAHVEEYAARVVERYSPHVSWYTPLNEPRITAWYCGRLGWWPPYLRGQKGFFRVLMGVCRGIVQTSRAILRQNPQAVLIHVDATDLYSTPHPELEEQARMRQETVFLALDLVSGKVGSDHVLYDPLVKGGVSPELLHWFLDNNVPLDVVGINLYPMFSQKTLLRTNRGTRIQMKYGSAEIIGALSEMYYRRYSRPVMITETASYGSVQRRSDWMDSSIRACRAVRESGIPLVGYTWWPIFALVTWAYRQGAKPVEEYFHQMGLWDIPGRGSDTFERFETSLVEQYRDHIRRGFESVGLLASPYQPTGGE